MTISDFGTTLQSRKDVITQLCALISPSEHPDWDRFVTAHPLGTIYHHSSWLNALRATYPRISFSAFALMCHDRIRSALVFSIRKKSVISIPFTPYCSPLAQSGEELEPLIDAVAGLIDARAAEQYELRALDPHGSFGTRLVRAGYRDKNHILRLHGGIGRLQKRFHPSCINKSIRKALKSGVTVRQGSSGADLDVFFRLFARTRKELGLPIPPITLFTNMWHSMYPRTLVLYIAEHHQRPVGALLALRFRDTVSFEYLGYLEREQHLRPGHLLYYTAIEKACEEGYALVDFRKTPAGSEGLLQFKRRWGTEERDIAYFYYPSIPKHGTAGNGALKRKLFSLVNRPLPFVLARQLGRVIYRYMG